jgi:23S rRNA (pseudouridine1915-N3)-methyltransferase
MKFRLVWVGSNADTEFREAAERYSNRIKHFFPIEVVTVAPEKGRKTPESVIRAESARLIDAIPKQGTTVVVDERGVTWSSLKLAKWLEEVSGRQPHGITFVLGGANGMDQSVRDEADVVLSLSSMTLPHELARVVLLEQIYRACTLIRNVTYHK